MHKENKLHLLNKVFECFLLIFVYFVIAANDGNPSDDDRDEENDGRASVCESNNGK